MYRSLLILSVIVSAALNHIPATAGLYSPEDSVVVRIMFYNSENLFDIDNDTLKSDDDFTPGGQMHWTYNRYMTKLNNISKVIVATGRFAPPDIIGLCEVENKKVLFDLLRRTPLEKFGYKFIHEDSPDERGIDVALLYNPSVVKVIRHSSLNVSGPELVTRDILYVKVLISTDTCHFFVNHWPSRSSGQLETEGHRIHAASVLKQAVDSIFRQNPANNIVIMGDFNDEPSDISISDILKANITFNNPVSGQLYDIASKPVHSCIEGTLKYSGIWNCFDQIIISGSLLNPDSQIRAEGFAVLQNPFLIEADEQYNGCKPIRTYAGFKYKGGYSDHLPVYVDIIIRPK